MEQKSIAFRRRVKAFTIVELIIVIAVIGILAAILIPAFSNIIAKANAKSALSDARNTLTSYLAQVNESGSNLPLNIVIFVEKANDVYAYGYVSAEGQLKQADVNPFKGYADKLDVMIEKYNGTSPTDESENAMFYLTPATAAGKSVLDSYRRLNELIDDNLPVSVSVFDGVLIPIHAVPIGGGLDGTGSPDVPGGDIGGGGADGKYALAVNVVPEGAASVSVLPTEASSRYAPGTKVTISFKQTSEQAGKFEFVRYSIGGAEVSTKPTYVVTMDEDKAVVVNFSAGAWDGTEDPSDTFGGGTGTSADPYIIMTPQQLYHLAVKVNGGTVYSGVYIKLGANIALNEKGSTTNGWTSIGTSSSNCFAGNFDGSGYAISGIYINKSTTNSLGLFGYLKSTASVKGITLTDTRIVGAKYIGGIVGNNLGARISDCHLFGNVAGVDAVGGIVGLIQSRETTISNCSNHGAIKASTRSAGGILGYAKGLDIVVDSCVNTGAISGTRSIGGIVGYLDGGYNGSTISNSYNTGAVSATNMECGGICGCLQTSYLKNCYNKGRITCSTDCGAIDGYTGTGAGACALTNNYYLTGTCASAGGGTAKTSDELVGLANTLGSAYKADYTGNSSINNGHPILKWQTEGFGDEPIGGGGTAPTVYTLMYVDGNKLVGSVICKAGDKVELRAALEKEGSKFVAWQRGNDEYAAGSKFTMPAGDVTLSAKWIAVPSGQYFYEARYVVGAGKDYKVIKSVTGTAAAGAKYTPDQAIVTAVNPALSLVTTAAFTVNANNNNLFIIYCAEGISTAAQLDAVRKNLAGSYFLVKDIDLSSWGNWIPLGTDTSPFTGVFNGNGHSITGMAINSASKFQGLFGQNAGKIASLHVSATIVSGSGAGFIVGRNAGTISCCSSSGTLKPEGVNQSVGQVAFGGIAGANNAGAIIDQCWTNASIIDQRSMDPYYGVSENSNLGGLVGQNAGEISNCFNFGFVQGNRSGTIVGLQDIDTGAIVDCYTIAKANDVGWNWNARSTIGEFAGNGSGVGVKGLVFQAGRLYKNGTLSTGFDNDSSYTGVGKTTEQMKSASTYTGLSWNSSIWKIVDGQYPTLKNNPTDIVIAPVS